MSNIPVGEELDFHYLLSLLPPLTDEPEYAWLPELFSIVGFERLINLCKYAGGETIKIPTLEELSLSIEGLQWFYNVHIHKSKLPKDVPPNVYPIYKKIEGIYDAKKC